ncbi:MAG: DUF1289 domain-containing protein [Betaproteobacteria bacterium]|nr:DUF1289 domain-containing protein [Betaproteobacteria bacterium]MBT5671027.1 DUF1289 domain-containing protein [Betaproteobacteria bacterium]MBT6183334.1 DUF1289 domain-containing protein [Betaproteobacteria bacterium]MBT7426552.1 DUF1289 domain-containing protein [Betaproteobacteria bacterium]MBT7998859.1 DUF1289 domain-containing protein [Betaproteobacteria bacterium]
MTDQRSPSNIESPCVEICQLDPSQGLCVGCFRTMGEISAWATMSNKEKSDTLRSAKERQFLILPDDD